MDADEARQQLGLARRGMPVRATDRWAIGLAAITVGLAMTSTVVLRPHAWNMVPFLGAILLSIAFNATLRTRPRRTTPVLLAALGVSLAWGVVESVWFRDIGDTTSSRWVSGVLFGAPVVLAGLFLLPAFPGIVSAGHARRRLDDLLVNPVRLSIVAALAAVDEAEFGEVRDTVEISDSTLSKQAAILTGSRYLVIRKGYVGLRPRTWFRLTRTGRRAFERHLAALREIAGD